MPFEAPAVAERTNGHGNGLAARLHSLAAAARNGSDAMDPTTTVMPATSSCRGAAGRAGRRWNAERRRAGPAAARTPAGAEPVAELPVAEPVAEPAAAWNSDLADGLGNATANGPSEVHPLVGPLVAHPNGAARTPASMDEDETPIFRSLRSNWLSADTGERPWADSEVDAGWDAADRVEATPPTRRTETGLPDAPSRQPAHPRWPVRPSTRADRA